MFSEAGVNQTIKLNYTVSLTSPCNKLIASKPACLFHKHPHLSVVKLLKNRDRKNIVSYSHSLALCVNEVRIIQSFYGSSIINLKCFSFIIDCVNYYAFITLFFYYASLLLINKLANEGAHFTEPANLVKH